MASDQSNTSRQAATTAKKARVPLDERRADVIEAALIEFGKGGYKGTSTLVIAERAGIQQPYIYAIFKNKSELFLACHKALNERLLTVYREHAGDSDSPGERLANMRGAYRRLLEDDTWAQCQLQVLAAGGNSELRPPIRREFDRLFGQIVEISGATEAEVAGFFATTTMVSAMTAIGEPSEMIDHLTVPVEEELAA